MRRGPVVVFLSTGRCGTQWLAATLAERYGDSLAVEHEPLGPLYQPRRYFRCYDAPRRMLEAPEVARHVERIAGEGFYVETGWPAFAALPLFADVFGERLRVVHLTRHPVPTALSHLAHSCYAGSARDDAFTRLATLAPSDPNVFQPRYAAFWDDLSPYERCLFWWTEVSLFGLEFPHRLARIPFLRVKSEDLLGGSRPTVARLLDFMDLRDDGGFAERTATLVDRWPHRTDRDVDPLDVLRHRTTVETAERLGYDAGDVDPAALAARYHGTPDTGLDRIGRYER